MQMAKKFHGFEPDVVEDVDQPDLRGPWVFLGNLLQIDYASVKVDGSGERRKMREYTHKSTGAPYVMTNADGDVLLIVDPTKRLRVTEHGIEN
jgi:hypothetical protein